MMTYERLETARMETAQAIKTQLRQAGYSCGNEASYKFSVRKDDVLLGEVLLRGVRGAETGAFGEVEFEPQIYTVKAGRYALTNGAVNFRSLLRRLEQLLPLTQAFNANRKAQQEREKADDAILEGLGKEPEGCEISVYNGLVDLKIADLTPSQAQAILSILKGAA